MPILDLTLAEDESQGLVLLGGDEEYDYLHVWTFKDGPKKLLRNVSLDYRGITRDGAAMLVGDDRQIQILAPEPSRKRLQSFHFQPELGLAGRAAAAILTQSRNLAVFDDGLRATLDNGQSVTLHRDVAGAYMEVDNRVIRGSVTESRHTLSPDTRLIAGVLSYRSSGGEIGSGDDLIIREVNSGRILSGHYRLSGEKILGITHDSASLLTQSIAGSINEYYVSDHYTQTPDWFSDLGPALTRHRLLPNLALSSISEDEYQRARAETKRKLELAQDRDRGAQFILEHFFGER